MNPEQVAEILQITPEAVRRMLREGEIRAAKVGNKWRVREKAVEEYIIQQEEKNNA